MFVKDDGVNPLVYPYSFRNLREDNPSESFDTAIMDDPADLARLAQFNVFPIVDNPPAFDPATQRRIKGDVIFVDPDYVRQYTVEDLTANEHDDRESRSLNWKRFVRRCLNNSNANNPYRQMQTWSLESGKGRYYHTMIEMNMSISIQSGRRLRSALESMKASLSGDTFTAAQITEWDNLFDRLGVNWRWADL